MRKRDDGWRSITLITKGGRVFGFVIPARTGRHFGFSFKKGRSPYIFFYFFAVYYRKVVKVNG